MKLPKELENENDKGRALRRGVSERLTDQKKTWSASGMHLGYFYEGSPVIIPDGSDPPIDHPQVYAPTSRPGSRAPHVWIKQGVSTLDFVPRQGFALFRFGEVPPLDELCRCAEELGVPYTDVPIDSEEVGRLYEQPYVLVRPDGHVAWRGHVAPSDPMAIIRTITGR